MLSIDFISHGTLECKDLQTSRRFYEEVLGFEVIQNGPVSLMLRLGSNHVYVAVATGKEQQMNLMNHNGLDVGTPEKVDQAYDLLNSVKDEYGIKKVNRPGKQHGAYSFYFQDLDNNWWEILANPLGGYSPMFDRPEADLTGLSPDEFTRRAGPE